METVSATPDFREMLVEPPLCFYIPLFCPFPHPVLWEESCYLPGAVNIILAFQLEIADPSNKYLEGHRGSFQCYEGMCPNT